MFVSINKPPKVVSSGKRMYEPYIRISSDGSTLIPAFVIGDSPASTIEVEYNHLEKTVRFKFGEGYSRRLRNGAFYITRQVARTFTYRMRNFYHIRTNKLYFPIHKRYDGWWYTYGTGIDRPPEQGGENTVNLSRY